MRIGSRFHCLHAICALAHSNFLHKFAFHLLAPGSTALRAPASFATCKSPMNAADRRRVHKLRDAICNRLLLLGSGSRLRCFEADRLMAAVTERLVGRGSATAKRHRGFAGQVPLAAIGVNQLNETFHAIGTVGTYGNFHFVFRHKRYSLKKI